MRGIVGALMGVVVMVCVAPLTVINTYCNIAIDFSGCGTSSFEVLRKPQIVPTEEEVRSSWKLGCNVRLPRVQK